MNEETIASISTTPGESGIGIIRISGEDAINFASKLYTDKHGDHSLVSFKTHTIHYGFISDMSGNMIDEVMVSVMKAPNSYTRENVVEINCHGGIRVCRNILNEIVNAGARIAEPGEFTKRAFLNGRLDLTRAEAVMDTIRAQSDISLKQSVSQLRGSLYDLLKGICSEILYEIAHIEAALDDPDSISLDGYDKELSKKIESIQTRIKSLIISYDEGRILTEGVRTVILGNPNAGKSSLLNNLMGEERAIVTDIPGTTRDTLTEKILIGDISLVITDTAGIRKTEDTIEKIGISAAKKIADTADLIIYVADSLSYTEIDDEDIIGILKTKPCIVLLNKSDLEITGKNTNNNITNNNISGNADNNVSKFYNSITEIEPAAVISTSMITGEGISELKHTIQRLFYNEEITGDNQVIITNLRHVKLLKEAYNALENVKAGIGSGASEDLYCIDLTDAYRALAAITGAEVSEDIVNEIFSKFCMGK